MFVSITMRGTAPSSVVSCIIIEHACTNPPAQIAGSFSLYLLDPLRPLFLVRRGGEHEGVAVRHGAAYLSMV